MNHFGVRSEIQLSGDMPGWFDLLLVLDPGRRMKPALPWNPPRGARLSVRDDSSKNLHSRFDSGRKI